MEAEITRLYAGPDGESHFEDMKIPLHDFEGVFEWSEPMAATGLIFQQNNSDKSHGWHNAPRRQMIIPLAGSIEIEVGDGTSRAFDTGDVLLAEDMTGRGHVTRPGKGPYFKAVIVTLE
jgi:hypothetical protein